MKYLCGPLSSAFFNDIAAQAPWHFLTTADCQSRSISKQHPRRNNSTGVVARNLPLSAFAIVQSQQVVRLLPCPWQGSHKSSYTGKDSIRKLSYERAPDIVVKSIPKRSVQRLSFPSVTRVTITGLVGLKTCRLRRLTFAGPEAWASISWALAFWLGELEIVPSRYASSKTASYAARIGKR